MKNLNKKKATQTQKSDVTPVVVRVREGGLERAFLDMYRTADITKKRLREHFLDGRSVAEIAERHGCSIGLVANPIRTVRVKLEEQTGQDHFVAGVVPRPVASMMEDIVDRMVKCESQETVDFVLALLRLSFIEALKELEKK